MGLFRWGARAAVLVLLTSVFAACGSADALEVRSVLVDLPASFDGAAGQSMREAIRGAARDALDASPAFTVLDGKDGAVARVRLEQSAAGSVLVYDVSGRTTQGRFQYVAHAPVEDVKQANWANLSGPAVQKLAKAHRADTQSTDELSAWLRDGSGEVPLTQKVRAARILGKRRDKAGVDALAYALAHTENPVLGQTSLAALTAIGDAAGVDAVIAYSANKPPIIRRQAILAARAMGGQRAVAWLFTMSTGHTDPEVRREADEAFGTLLARPAYKGVAFNQTAQ